MNEHEEYKGNRPGLPLLLEIWRMLRPCEVLIERNAQREWAETQINLQAERMANVCNEAIARGAPVQLVRKDFIEYMDKVTRHYMPVLHTAVPHIQLVFSYNAQ